jgi:hypothetical protein
MDVMECKLNHTHFNFEFWFEQINFHNTHSLIFEIYKVIKKIRHI